MQVVVRVKGYLEPTTASEIEFHLQNECSRLLISVGQLVLNEVYSIIYAQEYIMARCYIFLIYVINNTHEHTYIYVLCSI